MRIVVTSNNDVGTVKFSQVAQVAGLGPINDATNAAYQTANTALATAQIAANTANNASNTANAASGGNANALAAYGQANGAFAQANAARLQANNAYAQANLAYTQANLAVINVSSANASNLLITGNSTNVIIDTRLVGGGGGSYRTDVYANGTITLANANLNFNNTATVNVGATANGANQANIAFSVNVSSSDWASAANTSAQTTFGTHNTTFGTVNTSLATINTNMAAVNSAIAAENSAFGTTNTTFSTVNTSLGTINTAIGTAYARANAFAVFANVGQIQANTINLSFLNTATVNATATANAANLGVNVSFAVNVSSSDWASGANAAAQTTFGTINTTFATENTNMGAANSAVAAINSALGTTNTTFSTTNTTFGTVNTAIGTAYARANAFTIWANSGSIQANTVNLNFFNTATVNAVATANAANLGANLAFSVNANAITGLLTTANASNVLITYTGAGATIDTRLPPGGGGGGGGAVYANGTLALGMPNANINFINTASVNAFAAANGTGQVNVSFQVNTTFVSGGTTGTNAANLVAILANGTLTMANANINFNNTSTVNVATSANTLGTFANVAFSVNVSSSDWAAAANSAAQTTFSTVNTTFATENITFGTINTSLATINTAIGTAYSRANAFAVFANVGQIQANTINLSFLNTATVNAVATANAANLGVNVLFSVNVSSSDWAAGANASAQTTFGAINTTFGTENTTFGTMNTTFGTVNTAIGTAYARANAFAVWANVGQIQANVINLNFLNTSTVNAVATANAANLGANVLFSVNVSGADWASGANSSAQTTFGTINTTFGTTNTNIGAAYARANLFAVVANGTVTVANAGNVNFNNTATVNVATSANGNQANVSFSVNVSSTDWAAAANTTAQSAYSRANTFAIVANGTVTVANAGNVNFNNTSTINVATSANGSQGNVAFTANTNAITGLITSANVSNVLLTYSGSGVTIDTRLPAGGGGGGGAVYANGTLALGMPNANINFINTSSVNAFAAANGTGQVNVSFQVNTTFVSGGTTATAAANLVAILANGTLTMANANINFNNSSTVNVATSANTLGTFANVEFAVNVSSRDWASGANATSQTTFGTINTTFATENTTFGTINTSLATMNTATGTAYARANAFAVFANVGQIQANTINLSFLNTATVNAVATANAANLGVNVLFSVNVSSSDWASGANASAQTTFATENTTFGTMNTTFGTVNTAIGTAYSRANAFAVWANVGQIQANTINLNFLNTATVNATATANAANLGVNVSFAVNVASSDWASGANSTAQTIFGTINTTFGTHNTTFGTVNTAIGTAYARANATAIFANSGQILANVINIAFANTATVNAIAVANSANLGVNVTFAVNVSSSDWASGANATSQTTFGTVNTTFGTVNTAIGTAYARANAFTIWANVGSIQANVINLNFLNTATVNAVATANAANLGANVLFSVNANAVTGLITTANVSNVVITYSAGGITIDTRAVSGGGGTPGGANTQLQFNNNGTFGGNPNVVFDLQSNTLNVLSTVYSGNVNANSIVGFSTGLALPQLVARTPSTRVTQNPTYIGFFDASGQKGLIGHTNSGQDFLYISQSLASNIKFVVTGGSGIPIDIAPDGNVIFNENVSVVGKFTAPTANLATLNSQSVFTYANGTIVVPTSNTNYNNTATVNVGATSNGLQANIAFSANINAVTGTITTANVSNVVIAYSGSGITIDTRAAVGGGGGGGALYANGTLTIGLANANLNFNNTATVNVATSANGTTQGNIAFSVNVSSSDWASGANASAQTTFGTHNTTFGTMNTTFGTVNTAIGTAYGRANAFAIWANVGQIQANTINLNFLNTATVNATATANAANLGVNVSFAVNVSSSDWASGANASAQTTFGTHNTTFGTVNTTFGTVNTAIGTAYARANATAIFANSGQILANVINIAFANTATVNAIAVANSANLGVNVTFAVNVSSSDWASGANASAQTTFGTVNTTFGTVNTNIGTAYARANAFAVWANVGLIQANTINLNFLNTATVNAVATANAANLGANVLFSVNSNAVTGLITTANVSNVVIAYSAGGITIDTRAAVGGGGGGGVAYDDGSLILGMSNANINYISSTTVNAVAVANGSTQVNVSYGANVNAITGTITTANVSNVVISYSGSGITIDTRAAAGGGTPGGATTQIQYNNAGAFAGSANNTWNATSNIVSVEGGFRAANASIVGFGGDQANTANSHFSISYNATASALDFTFLG